MRRAGRRLPEPDQSHFRSMDIWQAASTAETLTEGWLGQALKAMPAPRVPPRGRQRSRAAGAGRRAGPRAVDHLARRLPTEDWRRPAAPTTPAQKSVIDGRRPSRAAEQAAACSTSSRAPQSNTYASSEKLAEIGKNYAAEGAVPADRRWPTT